MIANTVIDRHSRAPVLHRSPSPPAYSALSSSVMCFVFGDAIGFALLGSLSMRILRLGIGAHIRFLAQVDVTFGFEVDISYL